MIWFYWYVGLSIVIAIIDGVYNAIRRKEPELCDVMLVIFWPLLLPLLTLAGAYALTDWILRRFRQ